MTGNSTVRVVTRRKKTRPSDKVSDGLNPNGWSRYGRAREKDLGASGLLLAELLGLVAELIGFLEELLLNLRVFFEVGLQPKQQPLVGHRVRVVWLDGERLVDSGDALQHVVFLLGVPQAGVLARLVLIVDGDGLPGFGVLGVPLGALFERGDRLVETSLPVVERGERRIDR